MTDRSGPTTPGARVVVTGHRGYLGCVLLPKLQHAGWSVSGVDSGLFEGCEVTAAGPLPDAPWRRKDIRDIEAADLAGADAVVHLAGLSNDPLGDVDPALTDAINHRATLQVATAAREAGVRRFVFASSCSNYGAAGDDILDESGELRPVTPYGQSKVDAERGLAALSAADFAVTALRLATAYGLSPRLRFDLVVNNLVAYALSENRVFLKSDGMAWRPLVHVQDIAAAFVAVLYAPIERIAGAVYNVVPAGENHRVVDIARMVAQRCPQARLEIGRDAARDLRNYRVSGERFATELPHWRPRWTVARGIDELAEALLGRCPPVADFEGTRLQRLAHLRQLRESGLIDAALRPAIAHPA